MRWTAGCRTRKGDEKKEKKKRKEKEGKERKETWQLLASQVPGQLDIVATQPTDLTRLCSLFRLEGALCQFYDPKAYHRWTA